MPGCGEGLDEVLYMHVSVLSMCMCGLELPRTWAVAKFGSTPGVGNLFDS